MTTSDSQTILDILGSDLKGIAELASRLAATSDGFDEGVETAQLVREIVQHHVAAEQYLHPLIRRMLPGGDQVAHAQFVEHRKLEGALRKLEDLEPAQPAFGAALAGIRDQWAANASYLDREVFPILRAHADQTELISLGHAALGAEQSGPTRPRVIAVEQPGANAVLSLAQGFVDRTIDAFSHRGHEGSAELDKRVQEGRYDDLED
jgi:hypothetical protein